MNIIKEFKYNFDYDEKKFLNFLRVGKRPVLNLPNLVCYKKNKNIRRNFLENINIFTIMKIINQNLFKSIGYLY